MTVFKRIWSRLVRLDTAAGLMAAVLLLAALGTCFPQKPAALAGQAALAEWRAIAEWRAHIQARYGALATGLEAAGAFNWFRSPLFLAAVAALAVATLACTLDRWVRLWRPAWQQPGARARLSALTSLANHLAVPLLLAGAALSSGLGWRQELTLAPQATVQVERGERLALRHDGFSIERYPNGDVANYNATLVILKDEKEIANVRRVVRVNDPLSYADLTFYLHSFQTGEGGYTFTLSAVYDPGYGLVVAAGCLLLIGATLKLCL